MREVLITPRYFDDPHGTPKVLWFFGIVTMCWCMFVADLRAEPPSNKRPNDAGESRLDRKVSVNFENEPLEQALQSLAEAADLKLNRDKVDRVLTAEGISDAHVTLRIKQPIAIKSALKLILYQHGVVFEVRGNSLRILPFDFNRPYERTFYLTDRLGTTAAENATLVAKIKRSVAPKSWKENGGKGEAVLSRDGKKLKVKQTQEVHEQLADFLVGPTEKYRKKLLASRLNSTERQPATSSDNFKLTDFHPVALGRVQRGRNYVYSGALQLAWNRLRERSRGAVRVQGDAPLVGELNRQMLKLEDVADDSFVAAAGTARDNVLESIRTEMSEKFPGRLALIPQPSDEDSVLLFGYLYKRLAFAHDFERLETPLLFHGLHGDSKVSCFGFEKVGPLGSDSMQVRVWDYQSDDDFVIELETKSTQDQLVLAKVQPGSTLVETVRNVQERMKAKEGLWDLRKDDSLSIPILDVNAAVRHADLEGKRLLTGPYQDHAFEVVQSLVRFRLDETGAILESVGATGIDRSKPKPRHFVFDRPFLVYLQESKAKAPFFAMWVENEEVMAGVRN